MGIGYEAYPVHVKSAFFVDELFVNTDGNYFGEEHVVASQGENLCYLALDGNRGFFDGRGGNNGRVFFVETHFLPLVNGGNASDSAVVEGLYKLFVRKIYDKFAGFTEHRVAASVFSYGNICHGRIGTDGACPGCRHDVLLSVRVPAADHYARDRIQKIAARFISEKDVFFIGRGIDYCIGLEGSLKLKEISYNHSEAYAAGELKHGTISLVEKDTPFVAIATQPDLVPKTVSNIVEVRSRGAYVLAVTNEDNTDIENVADYVIYIPRTNPWFCNSLAIIPLQLFAYYVAVGKGCDVDKPRNLAKSVTVE